MNQVAIRRARDLIERAYTKGVEDASLLEAALLKGEITVEQYREEFKEILSRYGRDVVRIAMQEAVQDSVGTLLQEAMDRIKVIGEAQSNDHSGDRGSMPGMR